MCVGGGCSIGAMVRGAAGCGDWMNMFQQRPSREKGCMTMLVKLL